MKEAYDQGISAFLKKHYQEAIAFFDQVICSGSSPHLQSSLYRKAVSLRRLRRYEEALACFTLLPQTEEILYEQWQTSREKDSFKSLANQLHLR